MNRTAFVSQPMNGLTAVFDKECESQDVPLLESVTRDLCRRLQCGAMAAANHDDDILLLLLCTRAEEMARYIWVSPFYPDEFRVGGDTKEDFSRTFGEVFRGVAAATQCLDTLTRIEEMKVEETMRAVDDDGFTPVSASSILCFVVSELRLESLVGYGYGYNYLLTSRTGHADNMQHIRPSRRPFSGWQGDG